MLRSGACECGCRFELSDTRNHKCSQRGLRSHTAFRPVCLIEQENEPSVWTYTGWGLDGPPTPTRHWALMGEIKSSEDDFLPGSHYCLVKTRFKEKHPILVRMDKTEEPATFQWSTCSEGDTMVILYPVASLCEAFRHNVPEVHVRQLNRVAVIPAPLEAVLEYSEAMLARDRGCHHCRRPLAEDQWCAKCKAARYCSRECQKAGWKGHRGLCSHTLVIQQLMGLPRAPFQQHCYFEMGPTGLTLTYPMLSDRLKRGKVTG